jgi:2-keto-4-pentenoate hydratase/2-oxohepta-3-ene-1,7-dioic acid hydratase in catechol pathway
MSVLKGPREEWRRILHEGTPQWVRPEGDRLRLGDGRWVAEAEATYLPPCDPTKIICIHLNYDSRRVEFKAPPLVNPTYFQKPLTALNSHRGGVHRPADCKYLNYEGEIAAIVGRPMRNVAREDVWDHLAGFAPANDVGAQDFRDTDAGSMLRVKGQDGFCPIGPGIVRGVDIREQTDLSHRLHLRRPVSAHHLPARRHRAHRHPGEFTAHECRRRGRGRGHRPGPPHEHRGRDPRAAASSGPSAYGFRAGPPRRSRPVLSQGAR